MLKTIKRLANLTKKSQNGLKTPLIHRNLAPKPQQIPQSPNYTFPVELRAIKAINKDSRYTLAIPERKAVIRTDTNAVLGIVGNRYKIITHSEVIDQIESKLPILTSSRKIELCRNGGLMFATYTTSKIAGIEVRKGDLVSFGIQLINSYTGLLPVSMRLVANRLVCSNGATVPKSISTLNVRHLHGANIIEGQKAFEKKIQEFKLYSEIWRKWAKMKIKQARIDEFGKKHLGKNAKDMVDAKYQHEGDDTIWGYFNALTWYGTHVLRTTGNNKETLDYDRKAIVGKVSDVAHKQFNFQRTTLEKFYRFSWN